MNANATYPARQADSISRLLWPLLLIALLLSGCIDGGSGDKTGGQTRVQISIAGGAMTVAAADANFFAPTSLSPTAQAVSWLLDTVVPQAYAASVTETFPYIGQILLQISGAGITTASINTDFNEGQFQLADGSDAILITDTDFSITVPDDVALTFTVTVFNTAGFRIFMGESMLTVGDLAGPNVSLPIPLVVDIDERIPRLVANTGCVDDDGDGICSQFEDVFVLPSGIPDIDGDGTPNSQDNNSDGDGLDDGPEGIGPSNDGFPFFIHKNQRPTNVSGVTITTDEMTPSDGVAPTITDPDVGDSHVFEIVEQPANGTASVANNQIVYTPNPGFSGGDSFTFLARDIGGLSRSGTANVQVGGTTTTTTSPATTTTMVGVTTTITSSVTTTTMVGVTTTITSPATTTTASVTTTTTLPPGSTPIGDVVFADANLRQCAQDIRTGGASTAEEITTLFCPSRSIGSLSGIEALTNLTRLTLTVNPITDVSPLAGLTNLEVLLLDSNRISDVSPLAGLTNLTSLDLGSNDIILCCNNISDVSPLAGLTNLTTLRLDRNNISDISPLAGLTSLESLDLGTNNIGDVSPLVGLTNLDSLQLDTTNISDVSPLAGMTNMFLLTLGNNNISDVSPLAGMTNLKLLFLENNNITTGVASLVSLTNFVDVHSLNLIGNRDIPCTDVDILLAVLGAIVVNPPEVCVLVTLLPITDPNFRACVEDTGALRAGEITVLDCSSRNIANSISGIEALINLERIDLSGNSFSDFSPLARTDGYTLRIVDLSGDGLNNLGFISTSFGGAGPGDIAVAAGNVGPFVTAADILNHGGIGASVDGNVAQSCIDSCFNFFTTGGAITAGGTQHIVIPTQTPIPFSALYRTFTAGWQDFDTSTGDSVSSAKKTDSICPSPGSVSYTDGLTVGDDCIELKITDGGVNDTDGVANKEVHFTGGVGTSL